MFFNSKHLSSIGLAVIVAASSIYYTKKQADKTNSTNLMTSINKWKNDSDYLLDAYRLANNLYIDNLTRYKVRLYLKTAVNDSLYVKENIANSDLQQEVKEKSMKCIEEQVNKLRKELSESSY